MDKIDVINGEFKVPEKYELSQTKRRLKVRTAWSTQVRILAKDNWFISTQMWFRSKAQGDKPYISEGFIELDGEMFIANIIKPVDTGHPLAKDIYT